MNNLISIHSLPIQSSRIADFYETFEEFLRPTQKTIKSQLQSVPISQHTFSIRPICVSRDISRASNEL